MSAIGLQYTQAKVFYFTYHPYELSGSSCNRFLIDVCYPEVIVRNRNNTEIESDVEIEGGIERSAVTVYADGSHRIIDDGRFTIISPREFYNKHPISIADRFIDEDMPNKSPKFKFSRHQFIIAKEVLRNIPLLDVKDYKSVVKYIEDTYKFTMKPELCEIIEFWVILLKNLKHPELLDIDLNFDVNDVASHLVSDDNKGHAIVTSKHELDLSDGADAYVTNSSLVTFELIDVEYEDDKMSETIGDNSVIQFLSPFNMKDVHQFIKFKDSNGKINDENDARLRDGLTFSGNSLPLKSLTDITIVAIANLILSSTCQYAVNNEMKLNLTVKEPSNNSR